MALGIRLPFAPVNEARDFVGVVLGMPSPTPGLVGTPGRGVLLLSPNPGVPIEDVLRLLSTGAVFVLVLGYAVQCSGHCVCLRSPLQLLVRVGDLDTDWYRRAYASEATSFGQGTGRGR